VSGGKSQAQSPIRVKGKLPLAGAPRSSVRRGETKSMLPGIFGSEIRAGGGIPNHLGDWRAAESRTTVVASYLVVSLWPIIQRRRFTCPPVNSLPDNVRDSASDARIWAY
jgi:hypothetical protein